MSDEEDLFETEIRGVVGQWPKSPNTWSYSTLREVEACPRRYMLRRSNYPTVWAKSGYPERPFLHAIMGEIIHQCLERILHALHHSGCEGLRDPRAIEVLRSLGGYSALIQETIQAPLARFSENPRAEDKIDSIRKNLVIRVPEMRERLQALLSRLDLNPAALRTRYTKEQEAHRGALELGSHPEVVLRAPSLKIAGRADLVTITNKGSEITDYKTGIPNEAHKEQLRFYSLLWSLDADANPNVEPVSQLIVSYSSHDERVDPPSPVENAELQEIVKERVVAAEAELAVRPPAARPSLDCRSCPVRHMCGEYWTSSYSVPAPGDSFGDAEVQVTGRNGTRSWNAIKADQVSVLLRSPQEQTEFEQGNRLRLLDIAITTREENEQPVITLTKWSEVYPLA